MALLSQVVKTVSFSLSTHSAHVFRIHLAILSSLKAENEAKGDELSEMIAKACGYTDSADMYSSEVKDIMERYFLTKEYAEWNKFSKERFKFEVIIKHCREGVVFGQPDSQVHRDHHRCFVKM